MAIATDIVEEAAEKTAPFLERLMGMLIKGSAEGVAQGGVLGIIQGWKGEGHHKTLGKLATALHAHGDSKAIEALGRIASVLSLRDEMRLLRDVALLYDDDKVTLEGVETFFCYMAHALTQSKRTRVRQAFVSEGDPEYRMATLILLVDAALADAKDESALKQTIAKSIKKIRGPYSFWPRTMNWPRTDARMNDFLSACGMLDHTPVDSMVEGVNELNDAAGKLNRELDARHQARQPSTATTVQPGSIQLYKRKRGRLRVIVSALIPSAETLSYVMALLTGDVLSIGGKRR